MRLVNAWIGGWTLAAVALLAGCASNADTYVSKGNRQYAAGKYGDAEISYRKAIQTQGNNSEAYYRLGLTYLRECKRPEAENAFLTAANGNPPAAGAKLRLADLRLEEYVADPQHPGKLREYLQETADEALARDPRSLDGLRIRGTLALVDQRPGQALEVFRSANQIVPFQQDIVHGLMLALALTGQTGEAEKTGLALLEKAHCSRKIRPHPRRMKIFSHFIRPRDDGLKQNKFSKRG
jgi:tetratricopeptide (TPR) repeat protein